MNDSNLMIDSKSFNTIYKVLILIALLAIFVFGIQWYMSSIELGQTRELLNSVTKK